MAALEVAKAVEPIYDHLREMRATVEAAKEFLLRQAHYNEGVDDLFRKQAKINEEMWSANEVAAYFQQRQAESNEEMRFVKEFLQKQTKINEEMMAEIKILTDPVVAVVKRVRELDLRPGNRVACKCLCLDKGVDWDAVLLLLNQEDGEAYKLRSLARDKKHRIRGPMGLVKPLACFCGRQRKDGRQRHEIMGVGTLYIERVSVEEEIASPHEEETGVPRTGETPAEEGRFLVGERPTQDGSPTELVLDQGAILEITTWLMEHVEQDTGVFVCSDCIRSSFLGEDIILCPQVPKWTTRARRFIRERRDQRKEYPAFLGLLTTAWSVAFPESAKPSKRSRCSTCHCFPLAHGVVYYGGYRLKEINNE